MGDGNDYRLAVYINGTQYLYMGCTPKCFTFKWDNAVSIEVKGSDVDLGDLTLASIQSYIISGTISAAVVDGTLIWVNA